MVEMEVGGGAERSVENTSASKVTLGRSFSTSIECVVGVKFAFWWRGCKLGLLCMPGEIAEVAVFTADVRLAAEEPLEDEEDEACLVCGSLERPPRDGWRLGVIRTTLLPGGVERTTCLLGAFSGTFSGTHATQFVRELAFL